MAKDKAFHCSVITPERIVLECEAVFAAFPAHDGEMGVLVNRAPLVCKLGIGSLRVESPAGQQSLFVDGGFAQMVGNRLTLLTEQAKKPADIDRSVAEKALSDAMHMSITTPASYAERDRAIRRAKAQLKLAAE